jgi:ATP-dependent Clp protease adaptor protein ClpS
MQTDMNTGIKDLVEINNLLGKPYKVILFNDESHNMYEVANQIIKAIHCSMEQALNIMLEAHTKGQAVAFTGSKERCELVVEILEQIKLTTDLIPA